MNSDMASAHGPLDSKSSSHGYVSPGSDTRKSSTSSTKKRASRAGTRSVTTLSAAQLERKRANDREAQRAIRQRTKDHIDHLERTVNDLRGSQEQSEKMVHATQQRNRELEEEVVFLRNKLNETGFSMNTVSNDGEWRAALLSTNVNNADAPMQDKQLCYQYQRPLQQILLGPAFHVLGLPQLQAITLSPHKDLAHAMDHGSMELASWAQL